MMQLLKFIYGIPQLKIPGAHLKALVLTSQRAWEIQTKKTPKTLENKHKKINIEKYS
jgi:hypothetical protein